MENINPKNIAQVIARLLESGRIPSQKDIVDRTGIDKSTLSNIISGKKNTSWTFIHRFIEAYSHLLSTIENSGKVGESTAAYRVTVHEPGEKRLHIVPPERVDGDTIHLLAITNNEQTMIISRQQVTIEKLMKRIDLLQKNLGAGLDTSTPKVKAG